MIPAAAAAALAARRSRGGNRVWAVAAGVGVGALVMVALSGGGSTDVLTAPTAVTAAAPAAAAGGVCADTGRITGLDDAQSGIARRAVAAADRHQVGDRGAQIITAAGIVESDLRNLDYGDRDSLGWLQQRPSQGWANARDVDKAADDFLAAMVRVNGWKTKDRGDIAQAVQRSGYPDRYGKQMAKAEKIVAEVRAGCAPAPAPVKGSSGKITAVLDWGQTQVGKPYLMGANGPDAWDCSSFSRTAMRQAGIDSMPRTARAQRDWCAAGNCTRIAEGSEQPGDLAFWDSYLGPREVGHVAIIRDPRARQTVDARGRKQGVINGNYPRAVEKNILEIWRPNGLTS